MRRLLLALPLLATLAAPASPAHAKDELVIGAAQFPSSLHPTINPEVIKLYALAFTQRQVSAFDKDWKPVCLLCAELPSLENGICSPLCSDERWAGWLNTADEALLERVATLC